MYACINHSYDGRGGRFDVILREREPSNPHLRSPNPLGGGGAMRGMPILLPLGFGPRPGFNADVDDESDESDDESESGDEGLMGNFFL